VPAFSELQKGAVKPKPCCVGCCNELGIADKSDCLGVYRLFYYSSVNGSMSKMLLFQLISLLHFPDRLVCLFRVSLLAESGVRK